jgi:iron complex transport system substrate-binding protein
VYVTNGSHYFSRPGPRLVDSLEILAHTLHPEVHPLPNGLPPPLRVNNSAVVNRASGVFA